MRHFLGLRGSAAFTISAADVTPDAVDWPDDIPYNLFTWTSIGQQIKNITSTINIRLNIPSNSGIATVSYGTNTTNSTPSTFTQIASGTPFSGDTSTFSVSNNDWLFFRFTRNRACRGGTITVTNTSDSNVTLDTFYFFWDGSTCG